MSRDLKFTRNIGIAAHIDAGKTTTTERILYYSGVNHKIGEVHDGASTMDWMVQEAERGITITSAATTVPWKYRGQNYHINIIDTPGHVDFTIEVERALRVLDGGVLVLCGVSGVQSQSLTVDRQMKRYNVPRLAFINKLDRQGSNPWNVIKQLRDQLKLNAAAVQIPIGLEAVHEGVIDLIEQRSIIFEGEKGENIVYGEIPEDMKDQVAEKRLELIERLADADDEIAELFLMEEIPDVDTLKAAMRRQTIACKFVPVFMGSAFKNKGVQPLLDGVIDYLPQPSEKENFALDRNNNEEPVRVSGSSDDPLLALAFKLDETQYGQLTYMRIYQGKLQKGNSITNCNTGKKVKLARIVRMHADEMEEINGAGSGEVLAMFGVDCSSMDTFSDGNTNLIMRSMYVPVSIELSYSRLVGSTQTAEFTYTHESCFVDVGTRNESCRQTQEKHHARSIRKGLE